MIEVYLFRHPRSQYNLEGKIQGQANSPLCEEGKHQAKEIAEALKYSHFTLFLASDLDRSLQFTTQIARHHKGVSLMVLQELRERSLGRYEGKPYDAIGTIEDVFQMAITKEYIEGGESLRKVLSRGHDVLHLLKSIEKQRQPVQQRVCISSHGAFVATLPSIFSGKPFVPRECRLLGHGEYHYFSLNNGVLAREEDMQLYCSVRDMNYKAG